MDFFSIFTSVQGAVELGLIYGFMALGIFVSFRILNVADLTVDGSFTFGAACSVMVTTAGYPLLGVLTGTAAGALAGIITAQLQTKLKIQPILAGIMTMTGLYSINLRVMGNRPNVSLINVPTIYDPAMALFGKTYGRLILLLLITAVLVTALILFFKTQLGMCIRATGDNESMVRSSSINADLTKTVGLAVANGTVGLSGALIGQHQHFSDMNMGIGMVAIALASLIIGEALFGSRTLTRHVIAVVLGSVVYRVIITFTLYLNIQQQDFKLISALIVTTALSYPAIREKLDLRRLRKEGARHA